MNSLCPCGQKSRARTALDSDTSDLEGLLYNHVMQFKFDAAFWQPYGMFKAWDPDAGIWDPDAGILEELGLNHSPPVISPERCEKCADDIRARWTGH